MQPVAQTAQIERKGPSCEWRCAPKTKSFLCHGTSRLTSDRSNKSRTADPLYSKHLRGAALMSSPHDRFRCPGLGPIHLFLREDNPPHDAGCEPSNHPDTVSFLLFSGDAMHEPFRSCRELRTAASKGGTPAAHSIAPIADKPVAASPERRSGCLSYLRDHRSRQSGGNVECCGALRSELVSPVRGAHADISKRRSGSRAWHATGTFRAD